MKSTTRWASSRPTCGRCTSTPERAARPGEEAGRLVRPAGRRAWQARGAQPDYIWRRPAGPGGGIPGACSGSATSSGALQGLASPGPLEFAPVPMAQLLDGVVAATADSRRPGQVLPRDYSHPAGARGQCRPAQQRPGGAAHNAAQALGGDPGRIVLRAREHGGELVIEVEDTGCGMDEATCARVRAFFTTRPVGQGGLGLSSAYRIVSQPRRADRRAQPRRAGGILLPHGRALPSLSAPGNPGG